MTLILAVPLRAAEAESAGRAMVILKQHCVSCHNQEKKKGDLVLTTRERALEGGENGPVLVPGDAGRSRLALVLAPDADPHMPPKGQLAPDEVEAIAAWIKAGAAWDEAKLAANTTAPATRPIELRPLPAGYHPVLAVAIAPDQKRLAAGRGDRVLIWDLADKGRPLVLELAGSPGDVVQSLAWSPDVRLLATGGYRGVRVWDGLSGELRRELAGLDGRAMAVAFTPDGRTLIAAEGEVASAASIRLFNVADGATVAQWKAHDDSILAIGVSEDGQLLASAGADRVVRLWDLKTGKEVGKLEGHGAAVMAVALSRDGALLASAGADREIKVWNVKTRDQKVALTGIPAGITGLAWADAKTVVSSADDGLARFSTEASKERPTVKFAGAPDVLYCVAVSADGKTIFGGCHDGHVYAWSAAGAKPQGTLPTTRPVATRPTSGPAAANG